MPLAVPIVTSVISAASCCNISTIVPLINRTLLTQDSSLVSMLPDCDDTYDGGKDAKTIFDKSSANIFWYIACLSVSPSIRCAEWPKCLCAEMQSLSIWLQNYFAVWICRWSLVSTGEVKRDLPPKLPLCIGACAPVHRVSCSEHWRKQRPCLVCNGAIHEAISYHDGHDMILRQCRRIARITGSRCSKAHRAGASAPGGMITHGRSGASACRTDLKTRHVRINKQAISMNIQIQISTSSSDMTERAMTLIPKQERLSIILPLATFMRQCMYEYYEYVYPPCPLRCALPECC
jgi:hypothetical protein